MPPACTSLQQASLAKLGKLLVAATACSRGGDDLVAVERYLKAALPSTRWHFVLQALQDADKQSRTERCCICEEMRMKRKHVCSRFGSIRSNESPVCSPSKKGRVCQPSSTTTSECALNSHLCCPWYYANRIKLATLFGDTTLELRHGFHAVALLADLNCENYKTVRLERCDPLWASVGQGKKAHRKRIYCSLYGYMTHASQSAFEGYNTRAQHVGADGSLSQSAFEGYNTRAQHVEADGSLTRVMAQRDHTFGGYNSWGHNVGEHDDPFRGSAFGNHSRTRYGGDHTSASGHIGVDRTHYVDVVQQQIHNNPIIDARVSDEGGISNQNAEETQHHIENVCQYHNDFRDGDNDATNIECSATRELTAAGFAASCGREAMLHRDTTTNAALFSGVLSINDNNTVTHPVKNHANLPLNTRPIGKQLETLAPSVKRNSNTFSSSETSEPTGITNDSQVKIISNLISTMHNVVHLEINVCTNHLLRMVAQSCQNLENLIVYDTQTYDVDGLIYLCGYNPRKVRSFEHVRGFMHKATTRCTKLRVLLLTKSLSAWAVAVALSVFRRLEELSVVGVSLHEVLTLLYGTNPHRHSALTHTHNLLVVREPDYELSSSAWFLMVKSCPRLRHVLLECSGCERFDKNLLGELVPLALESLHVTGVNISALLWFLKRNGRGVKTLKRLVCCHREKYSRVGVHTWTQAELVQLAESCGRLEHLNLYIDGERLVGGGHEDKGRTIEGGVTEPKHGNLSIEGGVTEPKHGNLSIEGGVTEPMHGNLSIEGGVTEPKHGNGLDNNNMERSMSNFGFSNLKSLILYSFDNLTLNKDNLKLLLSSPSLRVFCVYKSGPLQDDAFETFLQCPAAKSIHTLVAHHLTAGRDNIQRLLKVCSNLACFNFILSTSDEEFVHDYLLKEDSCRDLVEECLYFEKQKLIFAEQLCIISQDIVLDRWTYT